MTSLQGGGEACGHLANGEVLLSGILSHYGIRFCLLKTITLGPGCM